MAIAMLLMEKKMTHDDDCCTENHHQSFDNENDAFYGFEDE